MSDFKVTFEFNKAFDQFNSQLDRYTKSKIEQVRKTLSLSAGDIKKDIKDNIPVRKGTLKKSIFVRSESQGLTQIIGSNKFYFHMVVGGTKSHAIKPKNKKVLAWNGGSFYAEFLNKRGRTSTQKVYKTSNGYSLNAEDAEMAFSKGVMNPGQKGDDFLDRSFLKGRENLNYEIMKILKDRS